MAVVLEGEIVAVVNAETDSTRNFEFEKLQKFDLPETAASEESKHELGVEDALSEAAESATGPAEVAVLEFAAETVEELPAEILETELAEIGSTVKGKLLAVAASGAALRG